MFERILVPLDGSRGSERAIPVAAHIARASFGSIVFVSVVLPPVEIGTYRVERAVPLKPGAFKRRMAGAADYLAGIREIYASELAGIETEIDVADGAASPMIYTPASLEGVDLIVLCSHHEGGLKRWVFGSVAQEALRHSPVPVLVLNEHGTLPAEADVTRPLRVLVPVHGSAFSEAAILPAAQLVAALAAPMEGEVHLFSVVDVPSVYGKLKSHVHMTDIAQEEARQEAQREAETYVRSLKEACEAAFAGTALTVTSAIAFSTDVAGAIVKEAEQAVDGESAPRYDMIAMATHSRGPLPRLFIGSVTEHVLKTTKLPLLIVRPQSAETSGEGEEPEVITVVGVTGAKEPDTADLPYELP